MLSAGQRCYSGPAAGVALADRVSASNASRAPTATAAGGETRPAPPSSAAASEQPRAELGGRGPGGSAGPGDPRERPMEGRLGAESGRTARSADPVPQERSSALPGLGPAARCCPARRGVGHSVPLSTGMLESRWVQHGLGRCGPVVLDAAQPRRSCPDPAAAHCRRRLRSHGGAARPAG